MIYVASPFSSPLLGIQEQRYRQVCMFVDSMILKGFVAFSPIAYCHPIAQRTNHATDAETWYKFNMGMLRKAEAMYLLCLPGWEQSKGVEMELRVCKIIDLPVAHYDADFKLMDDHWRGHLVEAF